MAKTITKSTAVKSKKEQKNTSTNVKVDAKPKINLKRGKLASNWNSYADKSKSSLKNINVSNKLLENITAGNSVSNEKKMTSNAAPATGNCVAIDCEMVGINEEGRDHMLARVSLVDENGSVVYDTFVRPTQKVIDYRTAVSGVRPNDLLTGKDFKTVQTEVHDIIRNKILVGHAVRNDLKVLLLNHNKKYIRDTSKYKKFRDENNGFTPSLKFLSAHFLKTEIQTGEHSSIEDARAAMMLYNKFKKSWESDIRSKKT